MTPQQVALVRQSWAVLEPVAPQVTAAFYRRLFDLEPALEARFAHVDREAQGRKLIDTLATLVQSLDDPDGFVPMALGLGQAHVGYGATRRHYAVFGEALLSTLQFTLEPAWSLELHEAWADAYTLLAALMQRGGTRPSGAARQIAC
jgi:hemoglobin-like flavoprotein